MAHTNATVRPYLAKALLSAPDHVVDRSELRAQLAEELHLSSSDEIVKKAGIPSWWHRVLSVVAALRAANLMAATDKSSPELWALEVPHGVDWAKSILSEQSAQSATREVLRLLPMTLSEFSYPDIKSLQEGFFLRRLPFEQNGGFRYPNRGVNAGDGTLFLFQCDRHVIASAVYRGRDLDPNFELIDEEGNEYAGYLQFDVETIRVFDPINSEAMRRLFGEGFAFSQSKQELEVRADRDFELLVNNQRNAVDWPDESEADRSAASKAEQRAQVWRQIYLRRGQPQFRSDLLETYGKCLITGCTLKAALEAAHIESYSATGDNSVENGLLLRADVHTLFDLGLIRIHPETLVIEFDPSAAESYSEFNGRLLQCGANGRPSVARLRSRFAN